MSARIKWLSQCKLRKRKREGKRESKNVKYRVKVKKREVEIGDFGVGKKDITEGKEDTHTTSKIRTMTF